jgi:hypothetical protein
MTKKEREGLRRLLDEVCTCGVCLGDEVNPALDWIRRQIAIDEKRRKKRGSYRKSR